MKEILSKIDHSILKATTTEDDVVKGAELTRRFNFATLCILPKHVKLASTLLPSEKIATVIGFPLHGVSFRSIIVETEKAISDGASELDIVLNISLVKEKKWQKLEKELIRVREISEEQIIKLIMECCYLTEEEKITVGQIAVDTGWDFLKTSTGYGKYGATVEDVKLLKTIARKKAKVKASGGIRNLDDAVKFIEAGADRIGTSSGERIANEIMHSREV
ncbi:deoxyribose-phosphate aldolase [Desulfurobacterium indicum]|uniref:Deoxyribose-phosphate aldolase n=1 Tax=Desulfurobacterium indicum TaxID=1914305 RepID=A0A1R1MNC6_9BACT|nr:deoxyribose-phosphate aldolase [Desulfurobacterium indicum]OMH41263.1 deoxyribose-phosphate aldolase [Desulfurobacterium indicum]